MKFGVLSILVGWLVMLAVPACAAVYIQNDPGGSVEEYLVRYDQMRASGMQVVVDGSCLSACTLIFGKMQPPQMCVTRQARFGFHMASLLGVNRANGRQVLVPTREGTEYLMRQYPPFIRKWVRSKGGLTTQLKFLYASDLPKSYRCP